jgi:hypothetical protein
MLLDFSKNLFFALFGMSSYVTRGLKPESFFTLKTLKTFINHLNAFSVRQLRIFNDVTGALNSAFKHSFKNSVKFDITSQFFRAYNAPRLFNTRYYLTLVAPHAS